jgi:hypothetical protein
MPYPNRWWKSSAKLPTDWGFYVFAEVRHEWGKVPIGTHPRAIMALMIGRISPDKAGERKFSALL